MLPGYNIAAKMEFYGEASAAIIKSTLIIAKSTNTSVNVHSIYCTP